MARVPREELAPSDPSDFQYLVNKCPFYPKQVELSIKHGEGATQHTELVRFRCSPCAAPVQIPFGKRGPPTYDGLVECHVNREGIEAAARSAEDDWEW
jgi:hypothetical protein